MKDSLLLQYDTNSADDSKGVAMFLSGNLFLYFIGGMIVSFIYAILFCSFLKLGLVGFILSSGPVLFATGYAVLVLNRRPPHFQDDLLHTFQGRIFVESDRRQKRNPYCRTSLLEG